MEVHAGVRTCKCPRSVADILGDWRAGGGKLELQLQLVTVLHQSGAC